MVTCPTCGARWQSQAASGRTRCGRCRTVVPVPGQRWPGISAGRRSVTCPSCDHRRQSTTASGRTRCGQCRTPVYSPVAERGEGEGDGALRPSRLPPPSSRDRVPPQPRAEPVADLQPPVTPGVSLLAVLGTLLEQWAAGVSPPPVSVPPVAPVLPRVAASVPAGPAVPVRLRCGHTAVVSGPHTAAVGREIACPTCGAWSRVGAPAVRRCPVCTTGIALCRLSRCPMPPGL